MTQRLNTFVARFYPTSRRKAEELIFNGQVEVNGMIQKEPFFASIPRIRSWLTSSSLNRVNKPFTMLSISLEVLSAPKGVLSKKSL